MQPLCVCAPACPHPVSPGLLPPAPLSAFHSLFCEMTVSVSVFLWDLLCSFVFSSFTVSHCASLSCPLPLSVCPSLSACLSFSLCLSSSVCRSVSLSYCLSVCLSPSLSPQTESSHFLSFDHSAQLRWAHGGHPIDDDPSLNCKAQDSCHRAVWTAREFELVASSTCPPTLTVGCLTPHALEADPGLQYPWEGGGILQLVLSLCRGGWINILLSAQNLCLDGGQPPV